MTAVIHPSPLLKNVLYADAAVSGAVALLQLAASDLLAGLLALPVALLFETGVFLVAYVVMLVAMARSRHLATGLVLLVVLGNVGWALACAALTMLLPAVPTGLGIAFLLLQAAAVLVFAALEWAGLRASAPAASPLSAARS